MKNRYHEIQLQQAREQVLNASDRDSAVAAYREWYRVKNFKLHEPEHPQPTEDWDGMIHNLLFNRGKERG